MRAFILACALVAGAAFADDRYVETITLSAGTSVTSANTYAVQAAISCDGEVRYTTCAASSGCAATSTNAKITNFDLPVDLCLPPASPRYIALIRTGSSTVTCYVYRVVPVTRVCKQ